MVSLWCWVRSVATRKPSSFFILFFPSLSLMTIIASFHDWNLMMTGLGRPAMLGEGPRRWAFSMSDSSQFLPDDCAPASQETGREELSSCSTCKRTLSAPYISFRVPLDTRDLLTSPAVAATPSGDLDNDLHELLKVVNALLNDCGGTVCVHCSRPCPVALLDSVIDNRLRDLIANATPYDDNFERLVVNDHHLFYRVKPTSDPAVSTLSFPSFLSDNQGLVPPTQQQIQTIVLGSLKPSPQPEANEGVRRFYEERQEFVLEQPVRIQPSCKVHLHRVDSLAVETKRVQNYGEKAVLYWWEDLGLPRFVAALCKQQSGGSVYLGLAEEKTQPKKVWKEVEGCDLATLFPGSPKKIWVDADDDVHSSKVHHLAREEDVPSTEGYSTGRYVCQGVDLSQQERRALGAAVLQKVRSDMLWYPQYPTKDPLRVIFHPVKGGPSDLCVVELVVSKFDGAAFHDKTGPEAYGIKPVRHGHEIRRLSLEEFMEQVGKLAVRVRPPYGDSNA
ncbi:uncharacterized protein [Littorina saxatilis]